MRWVLCAVRMEQVLKEVLDAMLSCIAPILPHMAEDVWLNLPWKAPQDSVFQVPPLFFFLF